MTKEDLFSIDNLRIASPCSVGWESMSGDERKRFCSLCQLHVYNISEMTGDEVRELVTSAEGRICARLFRRADGTVLTRDCPVGLAAKIRRRVSRVGGAILTATLSMFSVGFGQSTRKEEQTSSQASQLRLTRMVSQDKQDVFAGTVKDESGALIIGATVTLTEQQLGQTLAVSTGDDGEFSVPSLPPGRYTLDVTQPTFTALRVKSIKFVSNETVRADIILKAAGYDVVGGMELPPDMLPPSLVEQNMGTNIIRREMIQTLPKSGNGLP
jgi:Carboxypeptidase regulatory-like domain